MALPRVARRELLVLLAILGLAALIRLPGLDGRGQWDADQGNEMLVLLHLVRDGQVPLLGPPTFAGTFHHGALYYYLLAPAAFLSDADPRAVTLEIALLGIVAVGAVWALGRAVAGPLAAAVAGLLAAVSPAAILSSTFIWNPNLVPLGSAVAVLGAVMARRSGRATWWLVAAIGVTVTMQVHVSGGILLPPLIVAFVLDAARRPAGGRRRIAIVGLAGAAIVALGYLPLLVHEAGSGFADTRGVLAYLGGGAGVQGGFVERALIAALRSLAWPFVGVVTEAPMAAAGMTLGVIALAVAAVRLASREERPGVWLLVGTILWSIPALALTAPTLTTSVPGLPNDHYHTFLDPVVIALVAAGISGLARAVTARGRSTASATDGTSEPATVDGAAAAPSTRDPGRTAPAAGRVIAMAALVVLVAVCVWRWPPAVSPDGGWPLADEAAVRVMAAIGVTGAPPGSGTTSAANSDGSDVSLVGLPEVKPPDSLRFPLERRGVVLPSGDALDGTSPVRGAVVVCDPLFNDVIGAPCGGPAEAAWLAGTGRDWTLVDAFSAGDRRYVHVYGGP